MADIDFDEFDGGYGTGSAPVVRRYDRYVHLAGAAASAGLLIGAIVWGYQLAVRDVSGVPVMRALGGAMRVAPADPGGNVAGHQGLSVNAVAAAGTAAPLPDTLFLAPAVQGLADEDAAGLAEPMVATAAPSLPEDLAMPEDLAPMDASFAADAPLVATEIPSADQDAVAAALAEALGEVAPAADVVQAGLVTSLRPMARPTSAVASAPVEPVAEGSPAVQPAAAVSVAQVDAATISVGTRLVQLGAFDDEAAAQTDWVRLAGRFPELMTGKSMVIEAAQSGGRTFYRLRAVGFADVDESRRFCTVLLAENATCIPVTQR